MRQPSVTVLVTLRNSAATIKQCVDSLLKISYKNYRIMVVDAFSNDGSYEILKKYGKRIDLYQVKGWAPTAYNWALRKIHTDYIALVDADCTVPKDWLTELMKGFSDGIVEVAGKVVTPKATTTLQEVIGLDLEDRYMHLGENIQKVPTMNVAFRTALAKRTGFNEKLRVGYDADFSYNLTKHGKIKYVPTAVMHHYHRATWKALLRQQYITASMMPRLYWKHAAKVTGDSISKPAMIAQPFLAYGFLLSLILSLAVPIFGFVAECLFVILIALYFYDTGRLIKRITHIPYFLAFYMVRTVGWCLGLPVGILKLIEARA
jgi:glycosyltransferase involved in cell wall biosynthesis